MSLIRTGIDIRRTKPVYKNLPTKKGVIEIGASDLAAGAYSGIAKPTKSMEEIRTAKSFAEIRNFTCDT